MRDRLVAIDWMRGLVMVLMTIDHASLMFNDARIATDSAYMLDPKTGLPAHVPGTALPAAQFFTRWITHLCAPTFLFLSGTSLALSLEKRRGEAMSERELDRHLFVRGAVILACEASISLMAGMGVAMLQVLYAIGLSLWLMIPLRRIPSTGLLVFGIGWFVVGEAITTTLVPIGTQSIPLAWKLLFAPALEAPITVVYPVTGWLAMMALGWVFGRDLLAKSKTASSGGASLAQRAARKSAQFGGVALLVFVVVRALDGYGNLGLHRDDASLAQWLHVSKYPPALAYAALELGLMGLFLGAFFALEARLREAASRYNPLRVYGQAALVYYMLHFIGLGICAAVLGQDLPALGGQLGETYAMALLALVALYPVCLGWRRFKSARPGGWPQYF